MKGLRLFSEAFRNTKEGFILSRCHWDNLLKGRRFKFHVIMINPRVWNFKGKQTFFLF